MSKVAPEPSNTGESVRFVEIRKRRKLLVYENCPKNYNGETVFYYHGAGGTYHHFKHQLKHSAEMGYRVVSYDMLGHGQSHVSTSNKHAFTFEQFCYDALALFDKFCFNKNNILVGHSYGTSLCTLVCSERKNRVKKLVLISGGGPYALAPQKVSLFSLPSCILACFRPILMLLFRKACFHSQPNSQILTDTELLSIDFKILRYVMRGQVWDQGDEAYHALITCPVLLILGKHDKFTSLRDEINMHHILSQSVLHTLEGGHMLPVECYTQVNELLASFFKHDISTHTELCNSSLYSCNKKTTTV